MRLGLPLSRFPRWIEGDLLHPRAAARIQEIRARADESLRDRIFAERVLMTRAYGLTRHGLHLAVDGVAKDRVLMTVSNAQRNELPVHDLSVPDVVFDQELQLPGDAAQVALLIPPVAGLVVKLDQAQWIGSENAAIAMTANDLIPVPGTFHSWRVPEGAKRPSLEWTQQRQGLAGEGAKCRLTGGLQ